MENCVFCRIVRGEIPARLVSEDEHLMAFHDLSPQAPVHVLVIPRKHIATIQQIAPEDAALFGHLWTRLPRLAEELGIAGGYRVVANCGESVGQAVFHLHYHLLGGRAMGWPPG
jgi:histidine triad (HIT) family protein